MKSLGEEYYNFAIELFEGGYYELAVENWIQAYELGYEKQQILENLNLCFIFPNEIEFRDNFIQNRDGITKISYEECVLDFIPVSEKKFYIYDKKEERFEGTFELEEFEREGQEEFGSILFADIWDIRKMLPEMKRKKWDAIYIVLNESEERFVSFLKLPRFREIYLSNVAVFQDTELMCRIFEQYEEFYLPKNIVAMDGEKYLNLISELHRKRLHGKKERKNVFLSICIPSYNRGTAALKNVQHLLRCPYDSEIEIIVSNNGSVNDIDGYQKIKKLQDTRIVYHEFEENQGLAINEIRTLELASGKFAVLTSDEDLMIWENLGEFLTSLKVNSFYGVFQTNGRGENFGKIGDGYFEAGIEATLKIIGLSYMTGKTVNMDLLRSINFTEIIKKERNNLFFEYYPHILVMLLAGKYAGVCNIDLMLWEETNTEQDEWVVPKFLLPETRISQQNDLMKFCWEILNYRENEFIEIFMYISRKTYYLLSLAYGLKKFEGLYTWEEICFFVYFEHINYLGNFPVKLAEKSEEKIKSRLQEIFFEALNSERILNMYSLPKQQEKRVFYQGIQKEFESGKDINEIKAEVVKQYPWKQDKEIRDKISIVDTFVLEKE